MDDLISIAGLRELTDHDILDLIEVKDMLFIIRVINALPAIDKAASVVHNAIYAEPVDREAASNAIWLLHGLVRPLIARFDFDDDFDDDFDEGRDA